MNSEAELMRRLADHAIACYVSEAAATLQATSYVVGNLHNELYYRTRAVVLYDRTRDVLAGRPRPHMVAPAGAKGE